MRVLRDIGTAFALLTVAPSSPSAEEPSPSTVAWFPWVGLVLGGLTWALLALVDAASSAFGDGLWLARAAYPLAVTVVAGWAGLTRMLHWDGLADVADAWWGGHDTARRLEIMADSATGAFAAAAVVFVALAQVMCVGVLVTLPPQWPLLAAIPLLGRVSLVFAAWLGSPARPGGLGARVVGRPGPAILGVAVVGVCVGLGLVLAAGGLAHGTFATVAVLACALLVPAAVPHLIALRMGGVTGDVMGASVLITETLLLMLAALAVTW